MRKFLLLLIAAMLSSLPAAAQVYRVEHLPEFAPARGNVWNKAQGKPDLTQEIELPNGAEVTLLDTLGRNEALVVYDGKKIVMAQRDLVWASELNAADAVDKIACNPRLYGLGRFPLHSAVGRILYSYDAAWLIAAVLLFITLVSLMRFIPINSRIYLLTGGVVTVLLTAMFWGLLLGFNATWLLDFDSFGFLRVLGHAVGYLALLFWLAVMIKTIQVGICSRVGVEPSAVKLRWVLLAPFPVFYVAMWLAFRVIPREGALLWTGIAAAVVVIGILAAQIWFLVRCYRCLGRKWGLIYGMLYLVMLASTIVLVPLTLGIGSFVLAVIIIGAIGLFVISWVFGSHVEKIDGRYYKVPNLPW